MTQLARDSMANRRREWVSVTLLCIFCATCCTTNPQQIEVMEFALKLIMREVKTFKLAPKVDRKGVLFLKS